ncbi:MAG TPA: NADH-quinone oxidoreductase subunit J [Candidatus Obscuribacterales bacterium]
MEQLEMLKTLSETNLESSLFYFLAAMAIPLAYGVILDRAVIRSGFLLIGVFGSICGLFLLLQAQFIALAQLMIYAVGITLVVVIALMLTNPRLEREYLSVPSPATKLGSFVVAAIVFMTIYLSLRSESWTQSSEPMDPNTLAVLGQALTTTYALPFEFASVLLLAALVGAVMLAKAERPPVPGEDEYEYTIVEETGPASGAGSIESTATR